jgi:hypothetical protein
MVNYIMNVDRSDEKLCFVTSTAKLCGFQHYFITFDKVFTGSQTVSTLGKVRTSPCSL